MEMGSEFVVDKVHLGGERGTVHIWTVSLHS